MIHLLLNTNDIVTEHDKRAIYTPYNSFAKKLFAEEALDFSRQKQTTLLKAILYFAQGMLKNYLELN